MVLSIATINLIKEKQTSQHPCTAAGYLPGSHATRSAVRIYFYKYSSITGAIEAHKFASVREQAGATPPSAKPLLWLGEAVPPHRDRSPTPSSSAYLAPLALSCFACLSTQPLLCFSDLLPGCLSRENLIDTTKKKIQNIMNQEE